MVTSRFIRLFHRKTTEAFYVSGRFGTLWLNARPAHSSDPAPSVSLFVRGEQLDPTQVDSIVVLVWSARYLGLAVEQLAPGPLMELKKALQAACATLCRCSASHVSAPPGCPFRAVPRHLIKVGAANGLARKEIAPAFSARARTLSSGKAVMKMNGTP